MLGVSRASLYRVLWAWSALPGQLGNACLYLAAGLLRADDLDAAARGEWAGFNISEEDVDAGLSREDDWSPEPGDVFWRRRPGRTLRYRHQFRREALHAEIAAAGFRPVSDEHAEGSLTWMAAVRP